MTQEHEQKIKDLMVLLKQGELDEVITGAELLHKDTDVETRETAAILLGRAYYDKADFLSAVPYYREVASSSTADHRDQVQLAIVLVKSGKLDDALEVYNKAKAGAPTGTELIFVRCTYLAGLMEAEQWETAIGVLNELKEYYLASPSLDPTFMAAANQGFPIMLDSVLENSMSLFLWMSGEQRKEWIDDLEKRLHDEDKQIAKDFRTRF